MTQTDLQKRGEREGGGEEERERGGREERGDGGEEEMRGRERNMRESELMLKINTRCSDVCRVNRKSTCPILSCLCLLLLLRPVVRLRGSHCRCDCHCHCHCHCHRHICSVLLFLLLLLAELCTVVITCVWSLFASVGAAEAEPGNNFKLLSMYRYNFITP